MHDSANNRPEVRTPAGGPLFLVALFGLLVIFGAGATAASSSVPSARYREQFSRRTGVLRRDGNHLRYLIDRSHFQIRATFPLDPELFQNLNEDTTIILSIGGFEGAQEDTAFSAAIRLGDDSHYSSGSKDARTGFTNYFLNYEEPSNVRTRVTQHLTIHFDPKLKFLSMIVDGSYLGLSVSPAPDLRPGATVLAGTKIEKTNDTTLEISSVTLDITGYGYSNTASVPLVVEGKVRKGRTYKTDFGDFTGGKVSLRGKSTHPVNHGYDE